MERSDKELHDIRLTGPMEKVEIACPSSHTPGLDTTFGFTELLLLVGKLSGY